MKCRGSRFLQGTRGVRTLSSPRRTVRRPTRLIALLSVLTRLCQFTTPDAGDGATIGRRGGETSGRPRGMGQPTSQFYRLERSLQGHCRGEPGAVEPGRIRGKCLTLLETLATVRVWLG